MRSERELRLVAQQIAPLLPLDANERRRVCELACELGDWVDQGPDNPGENERVSVLRRK